MYRLHVTIHGRADMDLVERGDQRPWKARKRFRSLLNHALNEICDNPVRGERHFIAGMEVFTFHIRRWWRPTFHKLLYRVVGDTVEVGRLLHLAMDPQGNIPPDWAKRRSVA